MLFVIFLFRLFLLTIRRLPIEFSDFAMLLNSKWYDRGERICTYHELKEMVPNLEMRHLHAVIILAEELNFTRAAHRLHLTQSALSKQINDIEKQNRFLLFTRDKKRLVELTDAGRAFVEDARSALLHAERALHRARAAQHGDNPVLLVGQSPYAEHSWISVLLGIRLPLYPRLRIRLTTQFAMETLRNVLSGELNLALVTAPPEVGQITAVAFSETPLCAVIPEAHAAAHESQLALRDLANDHWILFARCVHPLIHDAIMDTARREAIAPKESHDIITGQQAIHLVSEHAGVAILPKPIAMGVHAEGVVVKPLSDKSLSFGAYLVMRRDDDSRIVNEFARAFLRHYAPKKTAAMQMELYLSA
jgi:DNA-binding transcriptional LysR family regulator